MTAPRSVRFSEDVIGRLARYVRNHPGTSASSVANCFVDEALRTDEHPGIMFRPGPTGRRAGLVGGPDVWEVIATLQDIRERRGELAGEVLAEATAAALGIPPRKVRIAVGYYAAYPEEVNDRITTNREAAQEAEAAWRAGQELLRGQAS